jgi:hypothetical protein
VERSQSSDQKGKIILIRKPEGKKLLGRPRSRWEGGISMDLQ